MPVLVALRHRTVYRYDRPVALGPQTIRLRPSPHARTPIVSYALAVLPEPHSSHRFQDPQGNFLVRVLFPRPTARFEVAVELTAEVAATDPFDFRVDPEAAEWPFRYPDLLEHELAPYRATEPVRPWLAVLLADLPLAGQSSVGLLVALNQLVRRRVAYAARPEPGVQDPERTLERGVGSCRDVAWLLVRTARSLGYAARFVSGYLIQLADPEGSAPGVAEDAADLHAWAEIYLPGAGWIGLDATSGLVTGSGHIPLASGAHPASAAPITGTVEAGAAGFEVEMSLARLAPRTFGNGG